MCRSDKNIQIMGTGSCLPEKILTNFDLEKMVDTSDEWIVTRTGIKQRRIIDSNLPGSNLAATAARYALEDAGINADEIDLIIVATITPDMSTPSTACIVQSILCAKNAVAFDINAACTGFIYAMTVAKQFLTTGYCSNALIIGVDVLSRITDWSDRNTCVLFGDGAGAAVLTSKNTELNGVLSTYIGADGALGTKLTCPLYFLSEEEKQKRIGRAEKTIWMDGSEVFKFAVKAMETAAIEAINRAGITLKDVSFIVPHQANIRIVEGAAKRLTYSIENIYTNIDKYGNMSAASIPVALDEANKNGRIKNGDNVLLVGFGGGMTWGSSVIKWTKE